MLSATELREEHENDFGGRPHRIRARRDAIREYTGLRVPRSLADVDEWYSQKKGVITRRLNEHLDDEAGGDD